MTKPMTEKETRIHLLEHARVSGYEQPILEIFRKIDEAMKHAKSKEEREIIAVQGLQEMDLYFGASRSGLVGTTIQGASETAIKKALGE
jgi:hypothetical protein